jgi:endonuclease G
LEPSAASASRFEEGETGQADLSTSGLFEPGDTGALAHVVSQEGEGGGGADALAAGGFNTTDEGGDDGTEPAFTLRLSEVVLPIRLVLSVTTDGENRGSTLRSGSLGPGPERFKLPYVDSDYSSRQGFDSSFLGTEVPLPQVLDRSVVARMEDGEFVLPYEHFSIVMHKQRRLCLFTASNVHGAARMRRPEPGRDYSRDGLSGLSKNDQEFWLVDPRIPAQHQLPDRFFTRDGQAFDKGHVVRREDVCWGSSYQQIRVANGDTFHTPNCTPQVGGFNRSNLGGRWGELENFIASQARTEKLSLLAGPVLADDDRFFDGVDDRGAVRIQIPRRFWKVVLASSDGGLRAFGFLLEQDLADVPLEFAVEGGWKKELIALSDLQKILGLVEFPDQIHAADQYTSALGQELVERTSATRRR